MVIRYPHSSAARVLVLGMMLAHFAGASAGTASDAGNDIIWFNIPAPESNPGWLREALPIGNGRLGCMVRGGIAREHIQFNEDTVWIGDEETTGAYQNFGHLYIDFAIDPAALAHPATPQESDATEAPPRSKGGKPWDSERASTPEPALQHVTGYRRELDINKEFAFY